jgi:hypothetical protein
MESTFDFSLCPVCNEAMRLSFVEPRRLHTEEKYERHIYRCGYCANVSQFIFEYPSRAYD